MKKAGIRGERRRGGRRQGAEERGAGEGGPYFGAWGHAGSEEAALVAWVAGRKLPGEEEAASWAAGGWGSESGTRRCHGRRAAGGAW